MNSLFSTVLRGPSPEQLNRFSQWLAAWRDAKSIRKDCEDNHPAVRHEEFSWSELRDEATPKPLSNVVEPYAEHAEVGDILLLSPRLMPNIVRPVYVAIFTNWEQTEGDDELLVVAPYSELPIPATPGELLTENENKQLNVLCLWNARTMDRRQLRHVWKVTTMTPQERADAIEVWLHAAFDEPFSAALAGRVGPPVLKHSDPRHEYLAEESAAFSHLSNLAWDLSLNEAVAEQPATVLTKTPALSSLDVEPESTPRSQGRSVIAAIASWCARSLERVKAVFGSLSAGASPVFAGAQASNAEEFAFHLDDRVVTRLWQNDEGKAILWIMTEDAAFISLRYEFSGGESGLSSLMHENGRYLAIVPLNEPFPVVSKRTLQIRLST